MEISKSLFLTDPHQIIASLHISYIDPLAIDVVSEIAENGPKVVRLQQWDICTVTRGVWGYFRILKKKPLI